MEGILPENNWKNNTQELAECLAEYGHSDYYPLHMPGHKRNVYGNMPEELFRMDITEIDGFDNLHDAEGILKDAQQNAARLYGAEESFYLINGSTCGILSAISAAVPKGGHILIARNCHKSVYHACYLRNLTISYLYPEMVEEYGICEAVTVHQVQETLEKVSGIDAVLIVSPTYEGRIADIGAIAGAVHAKQIPLIVDEAHGAHLGFAKEFAQNSCRLFADVVIHSVHKTLPALTQTALLHVNGHLINRERLKRFLHIYQSSSPSYLLMAGIDNALNVMKVRGEVLCRQLYDNWQDMCKKLSRLQNLSILMPEEKQDVGKLLVSVQKTGLSGQQLYDMLLEEYHLQLEMAAPGYVLAMFTVGDSRAGFERLAEALLAIDQKIDTAQKTVVEIDDHRKRTQVEYPDKEEALPLAYAWDLEKEWCPSCACEGKYCGEFINIYPPGTPKAVPGERINHMLITWVTECVKKGLHVQGIQCRGKEIYLPILKV